MVHPLVVQGEGHDDIAVALGASHSRSLRLDEVLRCFYGDECKERLNAYLFPIAEPTYTLLGTSAEIDGEIAESQRVLILVQAPQAKHLIGLSPTNTPRDQYELEVLLDLERKIAEQSHGALIPLRTSPAGIFEHMSNYYRSRSDAAWPRLSYCHVIDSENLPRSIQAANILARLSNVSSVYRQWQHGRVEAIADVIRRKTFESEL